MEAKLKHLELIQNIIDRLAGNSFDLKRWTVLLVSAIIVLVDRESNGIFVATGIIPVIVFWSLDRYFLREERRFRRLYDRVRCKCDSEIDFSMEVDKSDKMNDSGGKTLLPFYGSLLAVIIAVLVVMFKSQ